MSELQKYNYQDLKAWFSLLVALVMTPIMVLPLFITHKVTATGITRLRWQAFVKPSITVSQLPWSQVNYVSVATYKGIVHSLIFHGTSESKELNMVINTWGDPGLRATFYAVNQLSPEKITEPVKALLKRRKR